MIIVSNKQTFSVLTEVDRNSCVWVLDNTLSSSACCKIIELFNEDERKTQGSTNAGIDTTIKNSIDFLIPKKDKKWSHIDTTLYESLINSTASFKKNLHKSFHQQVVDEFKYDTGYQIQKTPTNGQYIWHYDGDKPSIRNRSLVFIWYLNDNFTGGNTAFKHQSIKIEPKAGRFLIFPPFWTHVHCGLPVTSGDKYIVTGWIHTK